MQIDVFRGTPHLGTTSDPSWIEVPVSSRAPYTYVAAFTCLVPQILAGDIIEVSGQIAADVQSNYPPIGFGTAVVRSDNQFGTSGVPVVGYSMRNITSDIHHDSVTVHNFDNPPVSSWPNGAWWYNFLVYGASSASIPPQTLKAYLNNSHFTVTRIRP
ncbi:hypothetical protein [Microvirga alba]|uniref:Uncharacterized protein n=1 Tax=Microvirga alba TaxID=2791025 RepID=A0A931FP52_9HYPH|nr:hypothetical protein [Microvirga alba]MBF9232058.1 hypothetical protein [Microvirga alba]